MRALTVGLLLLASAAFAEDMAAPAPDASIARKLATASMRSCALNEQVTLNVNFGHRADTVQAAKAAFEKSIQEVEMLAKQAGVPALKLTGMNYSINAQPQYDNYGMPERVTSFQMNGNVTYQIKDADTAVKLMELLTKQNIQTSLNVNAYNNQPCD